MCRLAFSALVGLSKTYTNCKVINPNTNAKLYWTVGEWNVSFGLEASLTGWIALGIATNLTNAMISDGQGSDIMLGWVGPDCPNGCIYDYWATVSI
jgi:hypothetical protein